MDPVTLIWAKNYADERGVFSKFDATDAPAVGNDSTEGYAPGSLWVDVTNKTAYVCTDATTGAAVWEIYTGLGGHLSDSMPHQFVDGGTTYRYGFKGEDGHLVFMYEEVV